MTLTETIITLTTPTVTLRNRFGDAVMRAGLCLRRGERATWVLLPDPAVVPNTRKRLRRLLAQWGVDEQGDIAELLVSEMVTNAMRHSWAAIMTVYLNAGTLRCEVRDTNPILPRVCHAHEGDEGGRGMYLMAALSSAWGSHRVPTGKVVWFEVPVTPDASGPGTNRSPEPAARQGDGENDG